MNMITTQSLIAIFNAMGNAIESEKEQLCVLDGAIGDADHGITMSIGFRAVGKALNAVEPGSTTPTDVFNTAAKTFLNAVGASAGPLYATAFMRAGASVKGTDVLDTAALGCAIEAMAEGIKSRGKAEPGDKTMLDAWLPAAATAREFTDSESMVDMITAIENAANAGALSTINMVAKKGRSAKLGDRTIGHQDAGAASTAILISAMASFIRDAQTQT
ncbi:MAG: dihydroxyacetone kinase-like protein [Granulosicoccus sp.]|jgi:dihydroxyacetone kinase-like protein